MLRKMIARVRLRALNRSFDNKDYLDAYAASTDLKAQIDPKMAIGGIWDEMGKHQFEFLCSQGLERAHCLLDIGCGSLRGGQHFIEYLEAENYCGFDLSEQVIKAGRQLIEKKGLTSKKPDLRVNVQKTLNFDFVSDRKFDYILAQSVFSHLLPEHIEECFTNIRKVMREGSRFYFTFHPGKKGRRRSKTDIEYPATFFEGLAEKHGFEICDLSALYRHPRGQRMYCIFSADRQNRPQTA